MLKLDYLNANQFPQQLTFDIETTLDFSLARRVFKLPEDLGAADVLAEVRRITADGKDDDRAFFKYIFHRVASIAGVARNRVPKSDEHPTGIELVLFSLPNGSADIFQVSEAEIIGKFLSGIEKNKSQLIGFNSANFDVPVIMQRALVNRIAAPGLARPSKPWEGRDYFSKGSDYNIDILELISSYGFASKCSLNELALSLQIPGKLDVRGADVPEMWIAGKYREIIDYNQCDAATTYLVWLEILKFAGFVSIEDYYTERDMFRSILRTRAAEPEGAEHIARFLAEWDYLENNRKFRPGAKVRHIKLAGVDQSDNPFVYTVSHYDEIADKGEHFDAVIFKEGGGEREDLLELAPDRERCPDCGHEAHKPSGCLNLQSDNDCNCGEK